MKQKKIDFSFTGETKIHYSDSIECRIINNPNKYLDTIRKNNLIAQATDILKRTTSLNFIEKSSNLETYNSLFGISDRGKVLCTFEDKTTLVGFISMQLLNDGNYYFLYDNSTVLHLSSGHILPEFQGNDFIYKTIINYSNTLENKYVPKYISGYTQSPRLLRLMSFLMHNKIIPNMTVTDIDLEQGQQKVLALIEGKNYNEKIKNKYVVIGKAGINIYNSKLTSGNLEFDNYFYEKLMVEPEKGDLVHYFGLIPKNLHNK